MKVGKNSNHKAIVYMKIAVGTKQVGLVRFSHMPGEFSEH